ncbi:hypothetical protein I79_010053 [Cricetulus griseus]|uniref:Uncharacterized protein n=1 Tax=Cricetulus griseus TaxID=10029 RepID=G3HHF2_CRIGR|nr:hypothetical protein I79_010053 [Cricetulus griseus]
MGSFHSLTPFCNNKSFCRSHPCPAATWVPFTSHPSYDHCCVQVPSNKQRLILGANAAWPMTRISHLLAQS